MLKQTGTNYLANSVRDARREAGLTQHQLAEKANISIQTIRRLEHGTANLASWGRVLDVLGLELHGRTLPSGGTLGEQLALLRKRRGISQRDLCALIGVTQPTLVALERKGKGRLETLERVTVALGARLYLAPPTGQSRAFYSHAATSSQHHGWHTPVAILEALYSVFGTFDLDPCSPTHNRRNAPVRARTYFTLSDDGLMLPWRGTVFMNPPYGREIGKWVAKARTSEEAMVVALVPARTDTSWWHEHIANSADVFLLRGRLAFGKGDVPAPFPSALALWHADHLDIAALKVRLEGCRHVKADQPQIPEKRRSMP